MNFFNYLWYQPRQRWWLWLLSPLSGIFRVLVFIRRKCYRTIKSDVPPVVVIGNLNVGGTGKTPALIALARILRAKGLNVGIISRGYKGSVKHSHTAIILDETSTPDKVGDEPYLIYHETDAPVAVHPKRIKALSALSRQFNLDVVLSDDGLQHYALPRTLEVVVLDAKRQFGNGFCLPLGPLREPKSRLSLVDFILINQTKGPEATTSLGELRLSSALKDKAFSFHLQPQALISLGKLHRIKPITYLKGLHCHAVAGIADPERFFALLTQLGAKIIPHAFPDHHQYELADFNFKEKIPIIMTQKDAVKCEHFQLLDAFALEVCAELPSMFRDALLQKLRYNKPI